VQAKQGVGKRILSDLDTGAVPNLVKLEAIPDGAEIQSADHVPIRGANGKPIDVAGRVYLTVRLGTQVSKREFLVCERLATDLILGCDYCDRHVEAILPRKRLVKLDDGTTVPIVRKASARPPGSPKLPPELVLGKTPSRRNPSVWVTKRVTLKPGTHTWVDVATRREGTINIEPIESLYEKTSCLASNGIAEVSPGKRFRILVANFSKEARTLVKNQVVAHATSQPTFLVDSPICLADVLGVDLDKLKESERETVVSFKRRAAMDRDKWFSRSTDALEAKIKKDAEREETPDRPATVEDDVNLSEVPEKYHDAIKAMLNKHKEMWDGKLGEVKTTEHAIDLKEDAKPVRSHPYRAGPKERELAEAEIQRQLRDGVIEPAVSEWASPILFAPKGDGT